MLEININSVQLKEIQERLKEGLGNLTPAQEAVGEYMLGKIEEEFITQTDPFGKKWIPNSSATRRYKQAMGLIDKILQATGHMRRSATYQVSSDGQTLNVGFSDPKAEDHQLGRGVPQRLLLGVSDEDLQEIIAIYRDFLPHNNVY